jgi:hypothetical protein
MFEYNYIARNRYEQLKNNQSEPDFRWCFREPRQASTEDCRLRIRDSGLHKETSLKKHLASVTVQVIGSIYCIFVLSILFNDLLTTAID